MEMKWNNVCEVLNTRRGIGEAVPKDGCYHLYLLFQNLPVPRICLYPKEDAFFHLGIKNHNTVELRDVPSNHRVLYRRIPSDLPNVTRGQWTKSKLFQSLFKLHFTELPASHFNNLVCLLSSIFSHLPHQDTHMYCKSITSPKYCPIFWQYLWTCS